MLCSRSEQMRFFFSELQILQYTSYQLYLNDTDTKCKIMWGKQCSNPGWFPKFLPKASTGGFQTQRAMAMPLKQNKHKLWKSSGFFVWFLAFLWWRGCLWKSLPNLSVSIRQNANNDWDIKQTVPNPTLKVVPQPILKTCRPVTPLKHPHGASHTRPDQHPQAADGLLTKSRLRLTNYSQGMYICMYAC